MGIIDLLRSRRHELEQNAWARYRRLLEVDLQGKGKKTDADELAEIAGQLSITEDDVSADMELLKEFGELTQLVKQEDEAEAHAQRTNADHSAAVDAEKKAKEAAEAATLKARHARDDAARRWMSIRGARGRLVTIQNSRTALFGPPQPVTDITSAKKSGAKPDAG